MRALVLKETIVVGNAPINRAYTFELSDIANSGTTTYTNFEMYRINKVVMKIIPENNTANMAATTVGSYPFIVDCIDYNDSLPFTQSNDYLRYDNARLHTGDKPWIRKFTPASRQVANNTTGTQTYGDIAYKKWHTLNITDFQQEHYGYRLHMVPVATNTAVIRYNVWAKIYYSLKHFH